MSVDPHTFRRTMGCFATGVSVVTTCDGAGRPVGVTVSSFTSLSLDPPLVLFCLDKKTSQLAAFQTSGRFAVNVLGEGQREVSSRFASRGDDKWAGQDYELPAGGSPLIAGCLAWADCTTTAIHEEGDHYIFVGRVRDLAYSEDGLPLIYFRGGYAGLATAAKTPG